uniref:Uncharacterized protein n=1 Tax=Romanomermis culicivorax TaxID=13658 RepID=A0A915K249_ROMCU
MSNQELATPLCGLKGTVEALFNIIANTATEDNKREARSHQQEPDRQMDQRVNFPNVVLGSTVKMNAIAAQTVVPAVQVMKRGTPASPQEQHLLDRYPKTAPFHVE